MIATLIAAFAINSTVDRGTYTINYEVMGKGTPIVTIPGGPGFSGRALWSIGYELQDSAQIILVDQLGMGKSRMKSPTAKLDLSVQNTLKDLEALRKKLGHKKWTVFGQSWGAIVAVAYAAYYPDSVDRPVLTSIPAFNQDDFDVLSANLSERIPLKVQQELNEAALNAPTAKEAITSNVLGVLPYYFYDQEEAAKLFARMRPELFDALAFQALQSQISSSVLDPLPKLLKKWRGKALILHGHQDPTGGAMGYQLQQIMPNSKVIMFNRAGHFVWLEPRDTDSFFARTREFLNLPPKAHYSANTTSAQLEEIRRKRWEAGWPFGPP